MSLDFTKGVKTISGNKVVILSMDSPVKGFPVVGYLVGFADIEMWSLSGEHVSIDDPDLSLVQEDLDSYYVILTGDSCYTSDKPIDHGYGYIKFDPENEKLEIDCPTLTVFGKFVPDFPKGFIARGQEVLGKVGSAEIVTLPSVESVAPKKPKKTLAEAFDSAGGMQQFM